MESSSSPQLDSAASSSEESLDGLRRIDTGHVDQDEIEEEIDETSSTGSDGSSPLGWPLCRRERSHSGASLTSTKSVSSSSLNSKGRGFVWEEQQQEHEEQKVKQNQNQNAKKREGFAWEEKRDKRETSASEVELMKERFAKLLLGEDMSGGAKGVCTALAISNAITNLAASVFGELWRLEPLAPERKAMWRREMEWLLSVSDYIVELVPSWQSFRDGSNLEVMVTRPRSDIHINLPALRKLDAMLLESLDSYTETDFWYVEQGIEREESNSSTSCSSGNSNRKHSLQRQEEKWWLPTPRVPADGGLSDESRKSLQNQRDCNSQILKAAMAINGQVLSEMEVPDTFWDALPKNGKSCLGEHLYRGLGADKFSPDALLQQFDLSTEHSALEAANRIEAAIHVWQRKIQHQQIQQQQIQHQQSQHFHHQNHQNHIKHNAKSSWGKVKEFVTEIDRPALIERAESLLLSLKQRFPGLPQTALDMHKIQYNRDVGQSILESYSRVLESLAFNILARIDDVLFIDDAAKQNRASLSAVSRTPPRSSNTGVAPAVAGTNLAAKNRRLIPSGQFHLVKTPYATPFGSPNCSPPPAPVDSPKKTNSPTRLGKAAELTYIVKQPVKQAPYNQQLQNHQWKRSYARNLECSRNLVSPPGRD